MRRRPRPAGAHARSGVLADVLALAAVGAQIGYPLTRGRARRRLTVGTVLAFAGATLADAHERFGSRGAAALTGVAAGGGLAVELLGVHTGRPFGTYAYGPGLGPRAAGVPLVVPLAWLMMSGPALAAARRLAPPGLRTGLTGGLALASWDLFLDPQMVAEGNWTWVTDGRTLHDVPLRNHVAWLGVASAITVALEHLLPRPGRGSDGRALALYLWTYAGSVLAHAVFLRRPAVALSGGVGMGLVALPLARRLVRDRP